MTGAASTLGAVALRPASILVHRARLAGIALGLATLVGGSSSFLGWALDRPRLTDWFGAGISVMPNTALAAICAGTATVFLGLGRRRAAVLLGALAGAIGASTLLEHATGADLGIDTVFLFDRTWGQTGALSIGRMGRASSISWTLLGVAIALATRSSDRPRRAAAVLGTLTLALAGVAIIGYVYAARALYTVPTVSVIALPTALFVCATSLAVLTAVPEHGPLRLLTEDSQSGILARRLAPAIVLGPILLGLLRLLGERADLFDSTSGNALRTLLEIVLFAGVLWWTADVVQRHADRGAKVEASLRASERRIVETLESISEAFLTLDGAWRITFANVEAQRLLRTRSKELLGRTPWELFPAVLGTTGERELRRAANERVAVAFEDFHPHVERWFSCRAFPAADGTLAVYFEDVTERKEARLELQRSHEQLAQELADARLLQRVSTELVAQDDPQRFYDGVVDAARRLLRADFASLQSLHADARGVRTLELLAARGFDETSTRRWARVDVRAMPACGDAFTAGARVVLPDVHAHESLRDSEDLEAYRRLSIRSLQCTPLVARSGRVVGMLSTHWREPIVVGERELRLLDILARQVADQLERRELEQQRERLLEQERAARTEAERAGRLKDEFLATLSHELRTPLNAIIGWSQILKLDASDPARVQTAADVIERNGKVQAQLITDLLDVSRIISGTMRLETRALELAAVVAAAVESIQPTASAKGVHVEQRTGAPPPSMHGDPARLQQVVWNLLSNAVRFTPRGGRVTVALEADEERAQLSVTDTGEGIAPEFLPHVFERFRQADASAARTHGGLGLGLSIVKQLVELHGGTVRAASAGKGRGAMFTVELPLAPAQGSTRASDGAAAGSQRAEEPLHPARIDLGGARVLLVDDEPDGQAMLKRLLETSGARVVAVDSAERALASLSSGSFDALVSDVGMPGRDGFQLVADVRARGVELPAIALTAFVRDEDKARALAAGFDAHVAKPVEAHTLVATLARLLGARERGRPAIVEPT